MKPTEPDQNQMRDQMELMRTAVARFLIQSLESQGTISQDRGC